MRIKMIALVCLLSILSCQSQIDLENQINECFEFRIDNVISFSTEQVFVTFKEFESFLINQNILNGTKKSDYIKLIDNALSIDYSQKIPKDKHIYQFSPNLILGFYKECVFEVLGNNRNSNRLVSFLDAIDAFEASGLTNFNQLKEIVINMNFDNEKSRFIATALLYYCIFDR
jgi:hypothetical protein